MGADRSILLVTFAALVVQARIAAACQNVGDGCWLFKQCCGGLSCAPGSQKCYHKPRWENEPCSLGFSCGDNLSCEAGSQVCRKHGGLGDPCHATRPCGNGFSCQPGSQKCYNSPRKLDQPCSAGFGCEDGLNCEAGTQVCRKPGGLGDPCHATRPCGNGFSCQPGSQKCYNSPRKLDQPCSAGFGCEVGLACEAGSQTCKKDSVDPQFDYMVVAHMVNTPTAVNWAMTQGANAVEFDLQYSDSGDILQVKHSDFAELCDCSCSCGKLAGSSHVCSVLADAPSSGICGCYASSDDYPGVEAFIANIASKAQIKLAYFDTKLASKDPSESSLVSSGKNVITLIRTKLLSAKSYTGVAVVNGLERKYSKYIEGAWTELKKYPDLIPRVYFVYDFDTDGDVADPVNNLLDFGIKNVLYATGTSTCLPGPGPTKRIGQAKALLDAGKIKGSIIWTLDNRGSFALLMDTGATAIVTNKPKDLHEVVLSPKETSSKYCAVARGPEFGHGWVFNAKVADGKLDADLAGCKTPCLDDKIK